MTDGFAILPDATVEALHGVTSRYAWAMAVAVARQSRLSSAWSTGDLDEYAGLPRGDRRGRRARAELIAADVIEETPDGWFLVDSPDTGVRTQESGHESPDAHVRTQESASPDTGVRHPGHECPPTRTQVSGVSLYMSSEEKGVESTARACDPVTVPTEMTRRDRERPDVDVMRVWCEAWQTATGKRPITPHVYRAHLERFALWVVDAKQPATLDERDQWTRAAVDVVTANPWARREAYAPRCIAKLLRDGDVQSALDAMSAPGVRSQPTKPTKTTTESHEETNPFAGIDIADLANDWGETMELGD